MANNLSQQDKQAAGGLIGLTALAAGALTYWVLSDKKRRKKISRKINELASKSSYMAEDMKDAAMDKKKELMG